MWCGLVTSGISVWCWLHKKESSKSKLLNFVVGKEKFSIYKSRKDKIDNVAERRFKVEFQFYSLMSNLTDFSFQWCFKNVVYSVVDGQLCFSPMFAWFFSPFITKLVMS